MKNTIPTGVIDLVPEDLETAMFELAVPAIIEFCSPSSGASHIMSPCFDDLAQKYEGRARFYRLNVEVNPEAALRFEVTSIPCFVFVSGGEIMDRLYGVTPKCEIETRLSELLQESSGGGQTN